VSSSEGVLYEVPLVAADDVERMGIFQIFSLLFRVFVGKN
jgi:hypothetical protein